MNRRIGLVVALIGALAATNASALQLGPLRVTSHLGQPFTAYVEVLASVAESEQGLTATVLRDLFGPSAAVDVSAFQAVVLHDAGRLFVRVSSPAPIDAPSFSLRIKVAHGASGLTARYGVALTAATREVPAQRSLKRTRRAPARPLVSAAGPVPAQAGNYGPVKPGETLWSIARRSGARNVPGFIEQVFAANPDAFVGGNRNRLKVGVRLQLPTAATSSSVASSVPVASSASPTSPAPVAPSAPAAVQAVAATVELPAAPASEAMVQTAVAATVEALPAASDPEVEAMIAGFDAKMAAIRARYGEKPAAPDASPLRADTAVANVAAAAMPKADPPAVRKAMVTTPRVQAHEPARPAATPATPWWASLPALQIALGALIAGVLAGVFRVARQTAVLKQRERARRAHSSLEADRKADVSRKAENRVKLESEVHQMLTKKTAAATPAVVNLPLGETGPQSENEALSHLAGEDRLLAINANIAHGRYVAAELLLHQVIAENPRNFAAKLRLAEVYYITEQVTDFVDIARDLLEHHRGQILNDDWQRVMRMGKIIAPDSAPFSGVRAIQLAQQGR